MYYAAPALGVPSKNEKSESGRGAAWRARTNPTPASAFSSPKEGMSDSEARMRQRAILHIPSRITGDIQKMAETVHLFLKDSQGNAIEGYSSQKSLDREGSIECFEYKDAVRTSREPGSSEATGRHTYEPFIVWKRFDQSTPRLVQALARNERVDAEFRFYRPKPGGGGNSEHYFTIVLDNSRLAHISRHSTDAFDQSASKSAPAKVRPPLEEIGFVSENITYTYVDGNIEAHDSWSGNEA